MGKDTTGNVVGEQFLKGGQLFLGNQLVDVGHLSTAKKLNTVKGEGFVKTGQGQAGSVQIWDSNAAHEPLPPPKAVQIE